LAEGQHLTISLEDGGYAAAEANGRKQETPAAPVPARVYRGVGPGKRNKAAVQ
jgi:hypothetical protein